MTPAQTGMGHLIFSEGPIFCFKMVIQTAGLTVWVSDLWEQLVSSTHASPSPPLHNRRSSIKLNSQHDLGPAAWQVLVSHWECEADRPGAAAGPEQPGHRGGSQRRACTACVWEQQAEGGAGTLNAFGVLELNSLISPKEK